MSDEDVPFAAVFATETMAELSARQGRVADAVAIYRHLVRGAEAEPPRPGDDPARLARWKARLAALEGGAPGIGAAREAGARIGGGSPPAQPPPATPPALAAAPAAAPSLHRASLVIREPVRSGQVIYAEGRDLIVLAPVNPGAQLLADGHIHVYAPLKGRAVAGVHGARDAQVFCLALEPELVGVDTGYVLSDDVPAAAWGGAARVHLGGDGICVVSALAPGRGGAREDASGRRRAF